MRVWGRGEEKEREGDVRWGQVPEGGGAGLWGGSPRASMGIPKHSFQAGAGLSRSRSPCLGQRRVEPSVCVDAFLGVDSVLVRVVGAGATGGWESTALKSGRVGAPHISSQGEQAQVLISSGRSPTY